MKFITVAFSLGVAALAHAQTTDSLPTCAQSCVGQFTTGSSIGGCSSLDIKCICSAQSFLSDIACCLAGACSTTDQATAIAYAQQLCTTAGVTVPDAISCAASSGSVSSTAASSSSSATGAVASTTSTTSESSTSTGTGTDTATGASSAQTSNAAADKMSGQAGIFGAMAAAVLLL